MPRDMFEKALESRSESIDGACGRCAWLCLDVCLQPDLEETSANSGNSVAFKITNVHPEDRKVQRPTSMARRLSLMEVVVWSAVELRCLARHLNLKSSTSAGGFATLDLLSFADLRRTRREQPCRHVRVEYIGFRVNLQIGSF